MICKFFRARSRQKEPHEEAEQSHKRMFEEWREFTMLANKDFQATIKRVFQLQEKRIEELESQLAELSASYQRVIAQQEEIYRQPQRAASKDSAAVWRDEGFERWRRNRDANPQ